jgi:hypothetical protein
MKKFRYYLLMTLLLCGVRAKAANYQSNTSDTNIEKGHISYSIGTSMPLGKFGSTDYFEKGAGYAMPGIAIELNLTRKIHGGPYSWCISSRSLVNYANQMALINDMNYANPGNGYDVQWGTYSMGALMAGVKYDLKPNDKVTLVPRAMVGVVVATLPEMLLRSSWNSSYWYKESRSSASSFSSLLGLGMDVKIFRHMRLLANIDMQRAFPLFVGRETLSSSGYRELQTVAQRMHTMNFTVGLAAELK